jgi:hypothetical protein
MGKKKKNNYKKSSKKKGSTKHQNSQGVPPRNSLNSLLCVSDSVFLFDVQNSRSILKFHFDEPQMREKGICFHDNPIVHASLPDPVCHALQNTKMISKNSLSNLLTSQLTNFNSVVLSMELELEDDYLVYRDSHNIYLMNILQSKLTLSSDSPLVSNILLQRESSTVIIYCATASKFVISRHSPLVCCAIK